MTKLKTYVFIKLKTNISTKKIIPEKINFLQEVFRLEQLDTSTMDEMYLGQPFAISLCFFLTVCCTVLFFILLYCTFELYSITLQCTVLFSTAIHLLHSTPFSSMHWSGTFVVLTTLNKGNIYSMLKLHHIH